MTRGCQGAPYFRTRGGAGRADFKTDDFVKKKLGGGAAPWNASGVVQRVGFESLASARLE